MHFTGTMNHWDPAATDSFAKDGRVDHWNNGYRQARAAARSMLG